MTKKECLKLGLYLEDYFVYCADGWIYDNETGEPVARYSGEEEYNEEYFEREVGKNWKAVD